MSRKNRIYSVDVDGFPTIRFRGLSKGQVKAAYGYGDGYEVFVLRLIEAALVDEQPLSEWSAGRIAATLLEYPESCAQIVTAIVDRSWKPRLAHG